MHGIAAIDSELKKYRDSGAGRPKKLKSSYCWLVGWIDEAMEVYRNSGIDEKAARRKAFDDARGAFMSETATDKRRSISAETVERFYRAGVRELRPGEMRLAKEVDLVAERVGLDVALSECGDYGAGGVTHRRYARGKRALRKVEKN